MRLEFLGDLVVLVTAGFLLLYVFALRGRSLLILCIHDSQGVRARVAPALASRMFPANRSSGGRRYGYGFDGYGCRVGGRLNFR